MESAGVYDRIALPLLSIPANALLLLVILPPAAIIGYGVGQLALQRARASGREPDLAAGETTLGGIMALLELILAFISGNALSTCPGQERRAPRRGECSGHSIPAC